MEPIINKEHNMSTPRVALGQAAPDLYQAVAGLDGLVGKLAEAAGIGEGLSQLLKLRASQINGCAFCIKMHAAAAVAAGESADKVAVVPAWRETSYFSEKEAAALSLIEAVTLISDGQVSDDVYEGAAAVLTNEEIAAVEWIGISINAWNRIAIPSRIPVGPE